MNFKVSGIPGKVVVTLSFQTYDTCIQASPEIDLEEKIAGLRWELNTQHLPNL